MQSVETIGLVDGQEQAETEALEKEMESRSQSGNGFNIASLVISVLSLIIGVMGGLLVSAVNTGEWKGKFEQRIIQLEKQREDDQRQRTEDKQQWNYIQSQNEVTGKALARIEARFELSKGR